MSTALSYVGWAALAVTLAAPFAYLSDAVSLHACQWMMLGGTGIWFAASSSKLLFSQSAAA